MYVCVRIYMCVCVCVYKSTNVCIHTDTYIQACTRGDMLACTRGDMLACTRGDMLACTRGDMLASTVLSNAFTFIRIAFKSNIKHFYYMLAGMRIALARHQGHVPQMPPTFWARGQLCRARAWWPRAKSESQLA
jgi:hypothetical protein